MLPLFAFPELKKQSESSWLAISSVYWVPAVCLVNVKWQRYNTEQLKLWQRIFYYGVCLKIILLQAYSTWYTWEHFCVQPAWANSLQILLSLNKRRFILTVSGSQKQTKFSWVVLGHRYHEEQSRQLAKAAVTEEWTL